MAARGGSGPVGWLAVVALVGCCAVPALVAAGVAAGVLWGLGLGLAGALVVGAAVAYAVDRARRRAACEAPQRIDRESSGEVR